MIADTNVWSELTRPKGKPEVLVWLTANNAELWLSVVVIAEIRAGAESPQAGEKRPALQKWLATLEAEYRERTLMLDPAAAHALGKLLVSRPPDARMLDTILAAQALSRDRPIATRNLRDFEWTGVKLINPWNLLSRGSPND